MGKNLVFDNNFMPEGLNPRGGDAYTEQTRGRIPTDKNLWPEDYDRIAQKRAKRGGASEPVDQSGDTLDLLIQREEAQKDEEVKAVGWSDYENDESEPEYRKEDAKVAGVVDEKVGSVVGLRKSAGLVKPNRHEGTMTWRGFKRVKGTNRQAKYGEGPITIAGIGEKRIGVAEKRDLSSIKRGKAKRK